ncbi:hypothetical protein GUJ93_ZPchr0010g8453 [Zizania palustris]|uniref:Uncharacterized protein n=1 Tax=Zizania palustris TaxID=103762 RepID=A0A8J5WAC1_ZIZPA|nr:hypothetical protein GUJ93_ZPchr0010g8453 [Zizania palustris]
MLYMERSRGEAEEDGGADGGADAGVVVARYSLDVSAGCGGRHSALLDEYERLAFEAQLNRAILRRCYSEPSPARFPAVNHDPAGGPAPTPRGGEGDGPTGAGRFCRLHEAVVRWLEAVKAVLFWLRSAWERRQMERAAAAARGRARCHVCS